MSIYKRRRGGLNSLTGGSGDVNPQYMHLNAVQSAADTTTTTSFQIPIQRLQNTGRAQVMEVLKVFWFLPNLVDTADSNVNAILTTSSSGVTATSYANTRVIDMAAGVTLFNAASSFHFDPMVIHDLTDGAGHGMLVGSDNLYIQIASVASGVANNVYCKILYRWKDVSIQEYVGIVQAQQ